MLIGIVVLAVLAGGGTYAWFATQRVEIDEAFCPRGGPKSVTAVLIDRTDEFNPVQQADIKNRLEAIRDSIPTSGRLSIYTVGSTSDELRQQAFALCNPGSGEGLNEWIANPALAHRRWETLFDRPLQNAFDKAVKGGEADRSPILESIQSVSLAAFASVGSDVPKKLVVVSDLLQHTDSYSQYSSNPKALDFASFSRTPYYRQIRTDLSGVTVDILYLRRAEPAQKRIGELIGFWRDYLLDQGASDIHVLSIQG